MSTSRRYRSYVQAVKGETPKISKAMALRAIRFMRLRTARGRNLKGRFFARYRPSTAKRKGRFQPVTLRESLKLMNSLGVRKVRKDKYVVAIRGRKQEDVGGYLHFGTKNADGSRRMRARPWFGLRPGERRNIISVARKRYRALIPPGTRRTRRIKA